MCSAPAAAPGPVAIGLSGTEKQHHCHTRGQQKCEHWAAGMVRWITRQTHRKESQKERPLHWQGDKRLLAVRVSL